MSDRPCVEQPCDRETNGKIRCPFHKTRRFRGKPMHGPTRKRPHKLIDFDRETRTGMCRVCGVVPIVYSTGNPGFKCGRSAFEGVLKSKYSVSLEWYENKLIEQEGVCAICKHPEERKDLRYGAQARLSVDHDHQCCPGQTSCGKCVRGLLCHHCNTGIGKLRESPEVIREAFLYVERYK